MTLDQSLRYKISNNSQDQWFLITNPTVFNLAPIHIKVFQESLKIESSN
jgi:hypothetical protein